MSSFVPDTNTKRYVIIAPIRLNRPQETMHHDDENNKGFHSCPFCPGNETMTPPEVFRIPNNTDSSSLSWSVRVVPNKYPITDFHEVFILSPYHTADIPLLDDDQIQRIMESFHARYITHQERGNVIIFGNHSIHAGASIPHPHAQLVIIPYSIPFDALEKEPIANIIHQTPEATVYCPEFSQWPFEMWIAPIRKDISFGETTQEERTTIGLLLKRSITALKHAYESREFPFHKENKAFAYNYYISHGKNFFIRIIPRFIHRAGFELGTGLSVNTVSPSDASAYIQMYW